MINAEKFVKAWQSSKSAKDAAKKLGVSAFYASSRASYYRRMGVDLKKFKTGKPPLKIEELGKLIRIVDGGHK